MILFLLLILIIVAFGVAGSLLGKQKGESGRGAILGGLLGPVGLVITASMKGDRINCPSCSGLADPLAHVCPHCGRDLYMTSSPDFPSEWASVPVPKIAQPKAIVPKIVGVPKPAPRYFICQSGSTETMGPYDEAQIISLRNMKIVNEETLFCLEGTEGWHRVQ